MRHGKHFRGAQQLLPPARCTIEITESGARGRQKHPALRIAKCAPDATKCRRYSENRERQRAAGRRKMRHTKIAVEPTKRNSAAPGAQLHPQQIAAAVDAGQPPLSAEIPTELGYLPRWDLHLNCQQLPLYGKVPACAHRHGM